MNNINYTVNGLLLLLLLLLQTALRTDSNIHIVFKRTITIINTNKTTNIYHVIV